MRMITPQSIAFKAEVTEEEIRHRMAMEVLEQIGGLDADGKPLPGIKTNVKRGTGHKAGYVIEVTGPMPVRLSLPRAE